MRKLCLVVLVLSALPLLLIVAVAWGVHAAIQFALGEALTPADTYLKWP